jgi:ATP-binding cassette subfamily B protein
MWMAANNVVSGALTMGDFVMLNAFMIQLYLPLNWLGTIFREVKHCLTDVDRMFRLTDEKIEIRSRQGAKPFPATQASIVFKDVFFHYNDDRPILKGVSFEIPAGSKVAVVGPSGSGKSTLARLMFRFYDVIQGQITVAGEDLRDLDLTELRGAIGIVPQDTILFNDSILYNIQYGRTDASYEEVIEAAQLAHLAGFIDQLPQGFDTKVGERGLKLSGGEKQRVAIARTILKNPPVLILDEATSSLDSKSEQVIQAALQSVTKNRTSLVIAHRLSTIIDADQIVVLDDGRVCEQGTHTELLNLKGQYAELWQMQQQARRKEQQLRV